MQPAGAVDTVVNCPGPKLEREALRWGASLDETRDVDEGAADEWDEDAGKAKEDDEKRWVVVVDAESQEAAGGGSD